MRLFRKLLVLAATLAVSVHARSFAAGAGPGDEPARPAARLRYVRAPSAPGCADEAATRASVAARLGYDPFRDDADRAVVVTVSRAGDTHQATIDVFDANGQKTGSRALTSAAKDCAELGTAVAIALAITIDPLGIGAAAPSTSAPDPASSSASVGPGSSAQAAPPAPAVPAAPTVDPSPRPAEPPTRSSFVATLGAFGVGGAAPGLTVGLGAGLGVRGSLASIALEGRVDAYARGAGPAGGEVRSSILAASVVPCLQPSAFLLCAIATIGSLRGEGAFVGAPRKDESLYAAVGARLGGEAPLSANLGLRAWVDLLAPLTRTTLRIQDVDAWTTPPISALVGIAFAARFP